MRFHISSGLWYALVLKCILACAITHKNTLRRSRKTVVVGHFYTNFSTYMDAAKHFPGFECFFIESDLKFASF